MRNPSFHSGNDVSMAANFQAIGTAFVQHYYNTFDSNRSGLGPLYKENSCLSFEGESFQGAAAIVAKLTVHIY